MNRKLALMVGVAAQVTLVAGSAYAQDWTPHVLTVQKADPADIARVQNGRLRKTRYEESNEMGVVKLFADGKTGLYVQMQSGALNGTQPVHRQQAACMPIALTQGADGSVGATAMGAGKFVTDNVGQDYRNANKPEIMPINGGMNMLLMFNYRPQGTNNTVRYAKVLDAACNEIPVKNAAGQTQKQVVIMQKNNDDCDMHQSGEGPADIASDKPGSTHLTLWAGCNGNGQDDGWLNDITVTTTNDASGAATSATITKNFDVSLAQREERSRGRCTVADADPNTAICTWTEGNTQPQRDGTWIAAVDISSGGAKGAAAQSRVLWKKMIEGQKTVEGIKTYSVRANSTRVLNADGTRGDQLIINTADLRGNNQNNQKGGRYLQINLGVARATKEGLTWTVPMQNVTNQMLGIDATHLTIGGGLVQDGANLIPAMTFLQGSQNGGGAASPDLKVLAVDFTAKKFIDYGTHSAGGSYDRHLYSNYLGGNPGNQGRNFAGSAFVKNPFFGQNGSTAKFLMLHAMTGKDAADVAKPEVKQSGYVSVMAMLNPQALPPPPAGQAAQSTGQNATGGGQNAEPQPGDPTTNVPGPAPSASNPTAPTSAGGFSGGCSVVSGSTSASGLFFLLAAVGLVALFRRRRA